jgi:hypothetical protein
VAIVALLLLAALRWDAPKRANAAAIETSEF